MFLLVIIASCLNERTVPESPQCEIRAVTCENWSLGFRPGPPITGLIMQPRTVIRGLEA